MESDPRAPDPMESARRAPDPMDSARRAPDPKSGAADAVWDAGHAIRARATKSPALHGIWAPMHAAGEGEAGVVRLASAQHGLVTRRQLEAAGIGRGVISRRVRCGRLFRTTLKGVYLLGRPNLEPLARELGTILYFD